MKSIQIKDGYKIWRVSKMKQSIIEACQYKYHTPYASKFLHRSYSSMYIEWWLHNIGYYLTQNIACLKAINLRCKDVDLEEK